MGLMDGGAFTGRRSSGGGSTAYGGRAGAPVRSSPRITAPRAIGGGSYLGLGGVGRVGPYASYQQSVPQFGPGSRGNVVGGGPGSAPSLTPPPLNPAYSVNEQGRVVSATTGLPITTSGSESLAFDVDPAVLNPRQYASDITAQQRNARDFYTSYYSPEQQSLANQAASLLARQGILNANFEAQEGFLRRGNQIDRAQLGTQRQGIGIDLASIARQLGYYDTVGGLNEQQLGIRREDVTATADQNRRSAESDAIARGAWMTPGIGRTRGDIAGQLDRSLRGIGVESELNRVNTTEQKARLTDRRAQLGVESQRIGLSEQELALGLEQGLQQLNLDRILSVGGLMDALGSNDLAQQQLARQIIELITQNSGMFPTSLPSPYSPPAGGGPGGIYRQ